MTERTLILIKPDGVKNGHVGEIIARIERKGLKFVAMDLRVADRATAEKHYAEHVDKPFLASSSTSLHLPRSLLALLKGRVPLMRGGSSPAAPTPWARPPPAPSAATLPSMLPKTWYMVRIRRNLLLGKSLSGSPTCNPAPNHGPGPSWWSGLSRDKSHSDRGRHTITWTLCGISIKPPWRLPWCG